MSTSDMSWLWDACELQISLGDACEMRMVRMSAIVMLVRNGWPKDGYFDHGFKHIEKEREKAFECLWHIIVSVNLSACCQRQHGGCWWNEKIRERMSVYDTSSFLSINFCVWESVCVSRSSLGIIFCFINKNRSLADSWYLLVDGWDLHTYRYLIFDCLQMNEWMNEWIEK